MVELHKIPVLQFYLPQYHQTLSFPSPQGEPEITLQLEVTWSSPG